MFKHQPQSAAYLGLARNRGHRRSPSKTSTTTPPHNDLLRALIRTPTKPLDADVATLNGPYPIPLQGLA